MGDGKKILIADDSPTIVEITKAMLKEEGFDIITANNGAEALQKIGEEKPDLVLLDVMMPDMDGYSVLQALRRDSKPGDEDYVHVIIITSKDKMRDLFELEGVDGFLVKPFFRTELLDKIGEVFGKA
ncbi:MAG: response regulator [Actinomycetota bacterium]